MYDAGARLWTKNDLVDIERQLEQSASLDRFTLKCLDGTVVQVKNPFFGYWTLVQENFDGPQEMQYCSYFIDWKHQLARDFRGNVEDWMRLFEMKRRLWMESISCESFKRQIGQILTANPGVNKVVCFGLGDMARRPPEVTELGPGEKKGEPPKYIQKSDGDEVHAQMIQHAAALTIVEEIRCLHGQTGGDSVRLLTQDPQYTDDTKALLRSKGFEIMGDFGAGGFGEVDDDCIVFSAWVSEPIKQIVADLAPPAGFITLANPNPFNRFK
ncbi:hypothetical protein ACO1O0_008474 [Amphichorda felina]